MLYIELNPKNKDRWCKADFALCTTPQASTLQEGDVGTYCTARNCETPPKLMVWPTILSATIESTLPQGARAMIGNAGCELTFRHIFGRNAKRNIQHIIQWAKRSYGILGSRLVLASMDYDLIHDVMTGCKLLRWSVFHKIPLVIFCGYRFLFHGDEFEHIKKYSHRYQISDFGNPYQYPFREVSDAIYKSGAELWAGAGFEGGLQAGSIEKAERFGFKGVLTTRAAWETYFGKS